MKKILKISILLSVVLTASFLVAITANATQNSNPPSPSQCQGAAWEIGLPDGITCSSNVKTADAMEQDSKATSIFGSNSRLKPDLASLNQFCKQYTGDSSSYATYGAAHNYCNGCDQNISWWNGSSWQTTTACAGTLNVQWVRCATGCANNQNQLPTIGNFYVTPRTTEAGKKATLVATGVQDSDGSVISVYFYLDKNNNGVWEESDFPIGQDQTIVSGTAELEVTTLAGEQTFFARPLDNLYKFGNYKSADLTGTTCTNHFEKKCVSNSVYWYDSCNNKQELYQNCSANQICSNGQCIDQNIECYSKSDCGTDGFINSPFCKNGDVYKTYRTYTCNNAGTANSNCSSSNSDQLVTNCSANQTCSNGQCANNCISHSEKKCSGSGLYWYNSCGVKESLYEDCGSDAYTNNYRCSDNTVQREKLDKGCSNNSCFSNSTWENQQNCLSLGKVCSNGACANVVCSKNSDCGTDGYVGSPFCQGNSVYQNYKTWTCQNAGTANSNCVNTTNAQKKNDCTANQTCSSGSCSANEFSVSCFTTPNPSEVGQTVSFIASATGGTGYYTYSWTGACTGSTSKNCYKSFSQTGTQTANVSVTSGTQTTSAVCSVSVGQSCTPNASQRCVGSAIYWFDSCGQQGGLVRTCLQNQTCSDGNCITPTIRCSSNSDCGNNGYVDSPFCQGNGVWQNYKTYTCENPGTAQSSCVNSTESKKKNDCTGSQVCSNGSCSTPYIACSSDSQCGSSGYIGGPFCKNGDVYKTYKTYTCQNPGTTSSNCTSSLNDNLQNNCTENQTCSGGSCHDENIACSSNSDCGSNGYIGDNFCKNGDVYRTYRTYTCNNAGTANSNCSSSNSDQLVTNCSANQTCSGGSCSNINTCSDHSYFQCNGNNLYWYSSCGVQQEIYQSCPNGCYNNQCQNYNNYVTVQTNSATNVYNNSATLNGYLYAGNNNNCTNYVWFQYGNSTYYGSETNHLSQSYSGAFSQTVYNYNNYGTLHFRAVAQGCNGNIVYGQDMTAYSNNNYGNLSASKTVRNLTKGSGFSNSVYANPGDTLMFMITLQAQSNQNIDNVVVKDNLPSNLIYNNQLIVACTSNGNYNNYNNCNGSNYNYNGNISSGVYLNTIYAGQTVTITYQVQVAAAQNFSYGTTTLTNSAYITSSGTNNPTASAQVMVTRTAIYGASYVSTGLTNNLLMDSFVIPLAITLLLILMWRNGLFFGLQKWVSNQQKKNKDYKTEKELATRISEIQKLERA